MSRDSHVVPQRAETGSQKPQNRSLPHARLQHFSKINHRDIISTEHVAMKRVDMVTPRANDDQRSK